MKLKHQISKWMLCVFACLTYLVCFSSIGFADELIPYGEATSSVTSSSAVSVPDSEDYTQNLFGELKFERNETVQGWVDQISGVVSWLLTIVLGVLPSILTARGIIDILCILIKPVNLLLAGIPLQIYSDEVIAITGIQFAGGADNAHTNVEKKDLGGRSPILYYFVSQFKILVPAFVLFALLGSGLMFNGIFKIVNWIVSIISGMI